MANGDLIYSVPQELIDKAGFLINILQALGIVIIFYIVFNIINLMINKDKKRQLEQINLHLIEIKKLLSSRQSIRRNY